MKRTVKALLVSSLLLTASLAAAQEFETGYFLGGNPYAFRLNPAFQGERNFFSLVTGQTGLGTWSNLGVSTLLYPGNDGKLYTFMNDRVSASEVLGKVKKRNSLDADLHLNLLTVGFWSRENTFMTIDVNLRSLNALSVPYDLFRFWKEETEGSSTFDFSGVGGRSKTFGEIAFGWSRNFNDVFNVGFRAKALVGLAEAEMRMRNLTMTMSDERWEVTAEGELNMSSPAFSVRKDADGNLDLKSIEIREDAISPAGFGAAVDLGFSWNVLPLLTVSGSVLDLGTIRWNRDIRGATPAGTFSWVPSEKEPVDASSGAKESFDQEMDEAVKSIAGLFKFKDAGSGQGAFDLLPFRVNLAAEYRMPFYERLSVGALYTGRGGSCYSRHTSRLSLNWNPTDYLSLSTGTTLNKLGQSLGFAFSLHPAGVNLMLGCDYLPFRCVSIAPILKDLPAKYSRFAIIPADRMNLNLYVGLNVALGSRRLDYARRMTD